MPRHPRPRRPVRHAADSFAIDVELTASRRRQGASRRSSASTARGATAASSSSSRRRRRREVPADAARRDVDLHAVGEPADPHLAAAAADGTGLERRRRAHELHGRLPAEVGVARGGRAWVLDLEAKDPSIAYRRVRLWIDKKSYEPLRAEFYVVSGKLIKRAPTEFGRWPGGASPGSRSTTAAPGQPHDDAVREPDAAREPRPDVHEGRVGQMVNRLSGS